MVVRVKLDIVIICSWWPTCGMVSIGGEEVSGVNRWRVGLGMDPRLYLQAHTKPGWDKRMSAESVEERRLWYWAYWPSLCLQAQGSRHGFHVCLMAHQKHVVEDGERWL